MAFPQTPNNDFLEEGQLPARLVWREIFAGDGPVEVEIGCGNGRYLRRAAAQRPEHLFLGIERSAKYAALARDRMVKYGVANVRVCRGDATRLLSERVAPSSIAALHVYFTDPWPKKRHAKRRLFQTPFLEAVHRAVVPGGRIHVKVDLFWYFEDILGRFDRSARFRVVANGCERPPQFTTAERTGFEEKALRKRGSVYFLEIENLAG
jgi:tRNA (guanine-N7-)-methyltransferase